MEFKAYQIVVNKVVFPRDHILCLTMNVIYIHSMPWLDHIWDALSLQWHPNCQLWLDGVCSLVDYFNINKHHFWDTLTPQSTNICVNFKLTLTSKWISKYQGIHPKMIFYFLFLILLLSTLIQTTCQNIKMLVWWSLDKIVKVS